MEPFLTSPAASVAVVEATTNSSDAGGVQREAGDGCRSGLVPDVVPLLPALIPQIGTRPPPRTPARRCLTRGPAGHVEVGWWSTRAWDGRTDRWSRARHLCHQPARRSGPWNSEVVSRCRHISECRGLAIILF